MGYYLELPEALNKAEQLIKLYGAEKIDGVKSLSEVPKGKALVLVVSNGDWEVAGYIYNHDELKAASHDNFVTNRKRTWLLIDKEKVMKNISKNYGKIFLNKGIKKKKKEIVFLTISEYKGKKNEKDNGTASKNSDSSSSGLNTKGKN